MPFPAPPRRYSSKVPVALVSLRTSHAAVVSVTHVDPLALVCTERIVLLEANGREESLLLVAKREFAIV